MPIPAPTTKDEFGMWLSRLDLLAFGHFSNVRLDLGPGFHLVYGPNEAGKTTTLRAIRQLLFGFDERTTDNFLHKNPNLRVGGTICDASGKKLEVIRRKTRKESLRASDDVTVIDEILWQQVLSGIDEATFSRRYGIDHRQLTEGGQEIATGRGDLGEILFATASGIKDLSTVQKSFIDEAAELFRPQGLKQRINAALNDLKKQRDQVTQRLVLVTEWEEIDRQRQTAQAELDVVAKRVQLCQAERDQLESWKLACPHVQEQESVKQQLAEFGSFPRLPENFASLRQEAAALLDRTNSQERSANTEISQALAHLENIVIPESLLTGADELTRLLTDWGSHTKAQFDRQGLIEQLDRLNASSKELREKLGRPIDESVPEEIVLDRAQRANVGQLGRQQAGLAQSLQQARQQSLRLRQKIDEVQSELNATPAAQPLEALRQVIRQARVDGDLDTQRQSLAEEIRVVQADVDRQCEEIGLWTGPVADLKTSRIPPSDAIADYEKRFDTNQSEQRLLRARLNELEGRHKKLVQQIEVLQIQFQIPTTVELDAARDRRNRIWSEIRETASSGNIPTSDQLEAFERSMIEADRISDRLRSEADRVAQLADQLSDKADIESLLHENSVRHAELEAVRIELEKTWRAAWPDLNVAPLAPREMQTWLARRDSLLQRDILLTRRKEEAKAVFERVDHHIAALNRQMPAPDAPSTLNQQLELAERLLERNEAHRQQRVDAEERLATLVAEELESVSNVKQKTDEMDQWLSAWQIAMVDLKLPRETSVETASSVLETLGDLSDVQRQIAELVGRIQGIDRDATLFRSKVKSLCQQMAPELVESTTDDAVNSLREQLSNSQRDQAKLQEQRTRKDHAEKQIAAATEARARGKAIVIELYQAAGLPAKVVEAADFQSESSLAIIFQSLTEIEERSRQRAALEEKLVRSNERLQGLARELPVADFINQVRQQSGEAIVDRLRQLESEIPTLVAQQQALIDRIAEIQAELKRMDGRADAAEAEEKQQITLAQIRSDSEQYIRVKLAAAILHSAIEKYREQNRGPVLTAASELFRELTLKRFDGLRVDEDDRGNPVLVGIRTDSSEAVHVEGMSEGTCDQLYLALRLASLELEAAPRNRLPLIVDDILVQFDDERAAAALRILAKLARKRQVIFFTHHEHLLEIASKHLAGGFSAHRLQ